MVCRILGTGLVLVLGSLLAGAATLEPARLRCENLVDPPAIDVLQPRLSWIVESERRGARQSSYRVLVAGSQQELASGTGGLWDSGRVASDETLGIEYCGRPLDSRQECWWKIRVWDENGQPSDWSKPAKWSMGLLQKADWQAQWITDAASARNLPAERYKEGIYYPTRDPVTKATIPSQPSPMLRKEFKVTGDIRHATIYVTARGLYQLRINGQPVGDQQLAPGWTDYNLRLLYQTFDVTGLLHPGRNALAAMLGVGWYAGELGPLHMLGRRLYGPAPQLLLQLELELTDGSRQTITSDGTWRATQNGPVRMSEIYAGEDYDARREMPGWDAPGFDDSAWQKAVGQALDKVTLQAENLEPMRVTRTLTPVAMRRVEADVYQFDLGQNIAGWCRLRLRGKPGQEIILSHFESLDAQGRDNPATLFGARAAEHYICCGELQGEVCEPQFTYHGFRYIEVSGLGYEPAVGDLVGRLVRSDAPLTGGFESNHELANKLMHAALWTQMGNMVSVPTDCPQRIERLGWMGDIQAFAPTAMYHMDMSAFFAKWLADIRGAQFTNGAFTAISPYHFLGSWNDPITVVNSYYGPFAAAPGWSDAGAIIPYWNWIYHGDRRVLEENFNSARRWVDYIHHCNADPLIFHNGRGEEYGDWLPAGPKLESDLFATAFFARSTECVAMMAQALGRTEDARRYSVLLEKIRLAFQQTFINADASIKSVNPIAGIALALNFDLYPETQRAQAAQQLVSAIAGKPLPTGIQTSHCVMLELTRNGYHDAACRIMGLHVAPSWGYMMDQGATTIWENWQGTTSQNHFALGSVCEWIWQHIAGIAPDETAAGFKRIVIAPRPGPGFSRAKASYQSVRGTIATDWRVEAERITLKVTVPANTTATIRVPTLQPDAVTESGTPAGKAAGVKLLRVEKDAAIYQVGSGHYTFAAPFPSISVADPVTRSPHNGYHSMVAGSQDTAKWVVVDLGQTLDFDAVRLFPARPYDYQPDTPGFQFPVRFKLEAASQADFSDARLLLDHTTADEPNPGTDAPIYHFPLTTARFVRLTVTRLGQQKGNIFAFALAELQVLRGDKNLAKGAKVLALDSIETGAWSKINLTDGVLTTVSPAESDAVK